MMSSQEYELAFYGELIAGADLEDCKQKLAQLFKASPGQLEQMFSGKRVVLKSKLDQATGDKYLAALKARGAACQLELKPDAAASVLTPAPEKKPEPIPQPVATPEENRADAQVSAVPAQEPARFEPRDQSPQHSVASGDNGAQSFEQTERMSLAGEVADEVLAESNLSIEPVGIRLSEESAEVDTPDLSALADISIAPAGADLVDKVDDVPVAVPDVSHLSIKE